MLSFLGPAELAAAMQVSTLWYQLIKRSAAFKAPLYFYELIPPDLPDELSARPVDMYDRNLPLEDHAWRPIASQHGGYWTMRLEAPGLINGTKHAAMFITYHVALPKSRKLADWVRCSTSKEDARVEDVLRPGLMLDSVRLTKGSEPVIVSLQCVEPIKLEWHECMLSVRHGSSIGELLRQVDLRMGELLSSRVGGEET